MTEKESCSSQRQEEIASLTLAMTEKRLGTSSAIPGRLAMTERRRKIL